jgi:oxygen-independent coproporphyrinogen-3 oxidase
LEETGVRQYEISNFAREGHASRHNVKYWRREPYVGFGLDAHSMLRSGDGVIRRANVSDLEAYLADGLDAFGLRGSGAAEVERIGREQGFEEALFLGLRMNVGVELDQLRREFGDGLVGGALEAMRDVEEAGLVSLEGGRLRLTGRGRMVSNEVFSRLLVGAAA